MSNIKNGRPWVVREKRPKDYAWEITKLLAIVGSVLGILSALPKVGCRPPWLERSVIENTVDELRIEIKDVSETSKSEREKLYNLIQQNQRHIIDQGKRVNKTQRIILRTIRKNRVQ